MNPRPPAGEESGGQREFLAKWCAGMLLGRRRTALFAGGVLACAMAGALAFALVRGHVIVNRYTDATWHMAVADEFARTGVFGRDPFIPNAPAFAQFGLWDFVNGLTQRFVGMSSEKVFVISNGVTIGVFLLAAYLSGVIIAGRAVFGLLSLFAITVTCAMGETSLVRAGWPFALALSLYFLLVALLFLLGERVSTHAGGASVSASIARRLWAHSLGVGMLLGVVFSLHAFVGAIAVAVACVTLLACAALWWRRLNQLVLPGMLGVLGFCVVAAPWLEMHLSLRGILKECNAHMFAHPLPRVDVLGGVALGVLALAAVFLCAGMIRGGRARRLTFLLAVSSLLPLVAATRVVNDRVALSTSSFMAARVLEFVPSGLIMASVPVYVAALRAKPYVKRWISGTVIVVFILLSIPAVVREAKLCYYLLRTHDYDVHEYSDLLAMRHLDMRGRVLLSDSFTSYFARRFLGTYAVTVPFGHGSPAVDYPGRDRTWKRALQDPREAMRSARFEFVLFNRKPRDAGEKALPGVVEGAISNWAACAETVYRDDSFVLFSTPRERADCADGQNRGATSQGMSPAR